MKGLLKFCLGLAVIAAVVLLIGKLSGGAGSLLESAGSLVGGLLDEYEGFEGYDIEEATMFDEAYPVWEGDLEQVPDLNGAMALDVELGGCTLEILESDVGEAKLAAKNVGKLQMYRDGEKLCIRGTRKAIEDADECSIRLYLPRDTFWQEVELEIGAGSITAADLHAEEASLKTGAGKILITGADVNRLEAFVGAGEIRISDLDTAVLDGEVGVGALSVQGSVRERVETDCSVGNVALELKGAESDFNYELSGVLGSIVIGDKSFREKVDELTIDNGASRYMDLDCSVGTIKVMFEE